MKRNKNRLSKCFSLAAVFTAVCILISCVGCSSGGAVVSANEYAPGELTDVAVKNPVRLLHYSSAQRLEKLGLSSGFIELFIDTGSYGVAVMDTSTEKLWYSLPLQPASVNESLKNEAAAVSLAVECGTQTYYMNSQDNSVAFGSASYTKDDTGLTVKYVLAPDKETALKTEFSADEICFLVSLRFELTDGSLFVTSSWENLSLNLNAKIIYLSVLDSFGASAAGDSQKGDFMLVPDGCGAVIDTSVPDDSFSPVSFAVYGKDPSSGFGESSYNATIGAYGIKQGDNAVAVILESGASIAEILASRANKTNEYNTVGVRYNITARKIVEADEKIIRRTSSLSYSDPTTMCMRFLSGSNANYAGIAAACREQLIRENVLTTKTVETEDYLPFTVSLLGAVEGGIFETGDFRGIETLTTFEQAQDLLTRMRSKGINNINIRYKGALTGGIDQSNASSAAFLNILGGESGFRKFIEYAVSQNMGVFIDIDVLSAKQGKLNSGLSAAKDISGSTPTITVPNMMASFIGDEAFTRNVIKVGNLKSDILEVLINTWKVNFTGYSMNDAGHLLFTDYSDAKYLNREFVASTIKEETAALTGGRELMVSVGNFYVLKDADIVVDIPMASGVAESASYQAIPFVQLILHGTVDYSGEAVNNFEQDEAKTEMLHAIEYGACPSYEWCYEYGNLSQRKVSSQSFWYEDWINGAMTYYQSANEVLGNIRSARMTDHFKIDEGVFATEYDGSTQIYVNYNDTDYVYKGVTVPAGSFIRVG